MPLPTLLKVCAVPGMGFRLLGMERIGRFVLRAWLVVRFCLYCLLGDDPGNPGVQSDDFVALQRSDYFCLLYIAITLVGRTIQAWGLFWS